jgi:hypothetical protein
LSTNNDANKIPNKTIFWAIEIHEFVQLKSLNWYKKKKNINRRTTKE